MKIFKFLFCLRYLTIVMLSIGNFSDATAGHLVTVVKTERLTKNFELSLMAEVLDKNLENNNETRRSYHLSIELPMGLIPAIKIGSYLKVNLPTIHKNVALAQITTITKTRIQLLLANQIQQLEGQKLKADLPFYPVNLFKIPFQAIYSPRGSSTEVFTLSPDMKVKLVKIVPLKISSDGSAVVSSEQLMEAFVLVQGIDNLLEGDKVTVNKESGAML